MVSGNDGNGQWYRNRVIEWAVRENARAQLGVLVKRILRKCGSPPDR